MKRIKKNHIIITALAIMIAAAGYINYAGDLNNIIKIKDKERKNFYKQMKKIYALPGSIKEKEKQALINEMLMRGEDPRELLRQ